MPSYTTTVTLLEPPVGDVLVGGPVTVNIVAPLLDTGGGGGGGDVSSVFGRTGAVTAHSGDYAAFYDELGDAAAAQAAAEGYTDTQITAEVSRANAAYDAAGAAAAAQAAAIAASQPLDSDLTAIAALSTTVFGRALLTQADAAALRSTAGLGTAATAATGDFDTSGAAAAAQAASQPLDSDLTAIAALTTTAFGRSFLALADAAAGRTLLGLGTLATQSGTFSGTSSGTNTGDQTITLTGDVTGSGTGSFAATLKNTGTAGTTGDATHVAQITTDAQGRVTAAAAVAITGLAESAVTNLTTDLAAKVDKSTLTTKGDLYAATAASTPARLGVGSDGQVLTADSASTAGVKWATAASGAGALASHPTSGRSISNIGTGNGGVSFGDGTLYLTPVFLDGSGTAIGIRIQITGGGSTGSVTRLGIYSDSNGLPGSLLLDAGTVATNGTGYKVATISQALSAGTVWVAVCQQGAPGTNPALRYFSGISLKVMPRTSDANFEGQTSGMLKHTSTVSGALPSTVTPVLDTAGNTIRVWLDF